MSETLLPCPFCGGEAYEREHAFKKSHSWSMIICDVCGASIQRAGLVGTYEGAKQAAKDAWNTRHVKTCENVDKYAGDGFFICGACGFGEGGIELTTNYCPKCGAKVVSE